ncbi:hypothetical protein SVAN01_09475 [Stagonosporopsis vannaccii]|nr:hypothetical protein SVAN01_09475 [Stagonosporopsis vannaccii]
MKVTLILATIAATAAAAPRAAGEMSPAPAPLDGRADNCFFPSQCSAFWSGKCENHCGSRGFSHMSRDGCKWNPINITQKCCCIRK